MMNFDKELWLDLIKDASELDINTRVVLCQYSSHFDSRGYAGKCDKLVARSTGFSVSEVRKSFSKAKEQGWLGTVESRKGRGYQASWPEALM